MRFALAVTVAALAQLVVYLRLDLWIGVFAVIAFAYLLFAALGAGYFAGRRSALAGLSSVLVGALTYGVVAYATRTVPAEVGSLVEWEVRLTVAVLPYAIGGAATGAVGGWLRARTMARARGPRR